MGRHCLSMSPKKDARLIWVNNDGRNAWRCFQWETKKYIFGEIRKNMWAATWVNQQSRENSNQHNHPLSLIKVVAVSMKNGRVLSYTPNAQRRLIRPLSQTGSTLTGTNLSPFARCALGLNRHSPAIFIKMFYPIVAWMTQGFTSRKYWLIEKW